MIVAPRATGALWTFFGVARLLLALALLALIALDGPARQARQRLAGLPDVDMVAHAQTLADQRRYDEALVLLAGARALALRQAERDALALTEARVREQRDSWDRRASDVWRGAIMGTGTSLEELAGAIGADFFVFGDVRDLAIQAWRAAHGQPVDGLVAGLSAVGLATTLAPATDWAPALLKAARKGGAMSERFAGNLRLVLRARRWDKLGDITSDLAQLSRQGGPGAAAAVLRSADTPAQLSTLTRFAQRHEHGLFALLATGAPGAKVALREGDDAAMLVRVARKGEAGAELLASGALAALAKPHPVLGLIKGLAKGNPQALLVRVGERLFADWLPRLDGLARVLLLALGAWATLEAALLVRGARGRAALRNRRA